MKKLLLIIFFLILNIFNTIAIAEEQSSSSALSDDPCSGPDAFLAILDRPTIQDSACVVKPKHIVIEAGTQYTFIRNGGTGYNLPETAIRFGLPDNSEFVFIPPNFFHQTISGFSAANIGIKHEIAYTSKWIVTAEGLFTLPTGSSIYGSAGLGTAINGIAELELTSNIALTAMLGVSNQTLASSAGGKRFNSINPDLVLSWQPKSKLQLFGEIYGQTRTAPSQGSAYNMDWGVQYLLNPTFEIDAEAGFRLSGNLGGFNKYFGVGLGLLL